MFILTLLKDWKNVTMIVMGIAIIILMGTIVLEVKENNKNIKTIASLEKDAVLMKADIKDLTENLERSEKAVEVLEKTNKTLSDNNLSLQKENQDALAAQKKLLSKIDKMKKAEVPPSANNPNKPLEHFYFDEELSGIINYDILGTLKEKADK